MQGNFFLRKRGLKRSNPAEVTGDTKLSQVNTLINWHGIRENVIIQVDDAYGIDDGTTHSMEELCKEEHVEIVGKTRGT